MSIRALRRLLVLAFGAFLLVGAAVPAAAQGTGNQSGDAFVVLSGPADVARGSRVGDLVVFHGTSNVAGTVAGSLTAFDAPVTISGRVNGDVTVFHGQLRLLPGAVVNGDLVTATSPQVAAGATVTGSTHSIQTNINFNGFGWASRFVWWLTVSVATLLVGLLALWLVGRGDQAILHAGTTAVGPSIGWGALAAFGLPVLAVLALLTLIGIAFGLGLLASLWLIYTLGYAATAWIAGRLLVREPRSRFLALLAGWGILRLLALIPILAGLAWTLAVIFGLGAIIVAVWRAHTPSRPAAAVA